MKSKGSIRIMPLGDSITAGYTDNSNPDHPFEYGYRAVLYRLLTASGLDFTFVGESAEPFDNRFGDPSFGGSISPSFDLEGSGGNHHRGYGGWGIEQIHEQVSDWIEIDRPDLILLMIGINGINRESPKLLESLLETIFTCSPKVKLIIAEITPLYDYNEDLWEYNRSIREELVPRFRERGYSISGVDHYSLYLKDPDDPGSIDTKLFSNGINHPTNACYGQIADNWFEAILDAFPDFWE